MVSITKILRLLADPTRLRILALLEREELSVAEIQEILGMGQSRISSHLAQLKRAGVLADRRAGKHIFYGPAEAAAAKTATGKAAAATAGPGRQLRELIRAAAAEMPEAAADQGALQVILRKRRDQARSYFDRIAGQFGRSYCPGRSWEALAHLFLAWVPPAIIADLGAGEGMITRMLARRAKWVIAVDNSENMVAYGAELAHRQGFTNVEYRLGDLELPPIDDGAVDIALFSQALHHASNPARAIAGARRILRPGGMVAVLDLHSHQFEAARELYADRWLGFTEAELHQMFERAGFADIRIEIVAKETKPPHFQTILATATR